MTHKEKQKALIITWNRCTGCLSDELLHYCMDDIVQLLNMAEGVKTVVDNDNTKSSSSSSSSSVEEE